MEAAKQPPLGRIRLNRELVMRLAAALASEAANSKRPSDAGAGLTGGARRHPPLPHGAHESDSESLESLEARWQSQLDSRPLARQELDEFELIGAHCVPAARAATTATTTTTTKTKTTTTTTTKTKTTTTTTEARKHDTTGRTKTACLWPSAACDGRICMQRPPSELTFSAAASARPARATSQAAHAASCQPSCATTTTTRATTTLDATTISTRAQQKQKRQPSQPRDDDDVEQAGGFLVGRRKALTCGEQRRASHHKAASAASARQASAGQMAAGARPKVVKAQLEAQPSLTGAIDDDDSDNKSSESNGNADNQNGVSSLLAGELYKLRPAGQLASTKENVAKENVAQEATKRRRSESNKTSVIQGRQQQPQRRRRTRAADRAGASKCDSPPTRRLHRSSCALNLNLNFNRLALLLALALLLPCAHLSGGGGGGSDAGQAQTGSGGGDDLTRAVLATMANGQQAANSSLTALVASWGPPASTTTPNPITVMDQETIFDRFLVFGRIFIMSAIIVGDICGNSLVILSVCRHSKLRVTTNWFVVSLACADILVALFAMTFNASVIVSGRWLFPSWVCDFWNSCDVLASTASILHLCCISIDRYIAIMRPLDYPMKITTRRVMYALCAVWISSALLSYIPIFTGVYTTAEHIQWLKENPDQCEFVVNRVYAIVSSSISFWIPCCIMVFTYYRIYREATRQEKFIYKAQAMMPAPQNHHSHHSHSHHRQGKQRRSKSVAVAATSSEARLKQLAKQQQHQFGPSPAAQTTPMTQQQREIATTQLQNPGGGGSIPAISGGRASSGASSSDQPAALALLPQQPAAVSEETIGAQVAAQEKDEELQSNSGQSTPTKRSISKMKREHKAAKTLGIIMGVFILCWLPFFSWYTPMHICGHACDGIVPRGAVTILFWIGYFNSTLNPIIYAYFNHEFRDAFKKTLQWLFCCCQDLKCLRVSRPNDNQHYNCTYRSTQEIGLVSNS